MVKKMNKKSVLSKRYMMFLTVSIVTGFILGFSYNLAKKDRTVDELTNAEYERESSYRQQLIDQQERNKELQEELNQLQSEIHENEASTASNSSENNEVLAAINNLRLYTGTVKVTGVGIEVRLEDGQYDANVNNPNDYIIHESHLFKLINELKIAGAEAIAINGQRLYSNSYIVCNGPVITIDGKQYPAPYIVEAIGNQDTLQSAIELSGGIIDQLLNDRISVTIQQKDEITFLAKNDEM